jgi:fibronectin type 3 domain-containing protein
MNSYFKRILSATSILVLLSACTGGPSASKPQKVDKTLPQVSLNGYLSDMTSAAFEWKPITDSRVQGYIVYRSDPDSQKPNELQETEKITNARITHYLDEDLKPGTLYHYRFATYNAQGGVSVASEQSDVRTLPLLPSVSFFSTAEAMPRSAKLVWRPHTDNSVVAYRLERRQGGTDKWRKIATIKGRLNAEYIDEGLEDNTRYEYRLRSVTYDGILSEPSDTAAVITKAPPKPVSTISASQGKAGIIEIDWQVEADSKATYYRLYRATSSNGNYKLIADKLTATHYSDKIKEPGKRYFYKVSGVSEDGLESDIETLQAAMGTTLDAPSAPTNLKAMVENETVQLTWAPGDSRTLSYIVIKKTDTGLLSSETQQFNNIKKTLIIDSSLQQGEEYTFSVIGVDKYGIKSAPSASVQVKLKDKK